MLVGGFLDDYWVSKPLFLFALKYDNEVSFVLARIGGPKQHHEETLQRRVHHSRGPELGPRKRPSNRSSRRCALLRKGVPLRYKICKGKCRLLGRVTHVD